MIIKRIKKALQDPNRISSYLLNKKVCYVLPDKTFLKLKYRVAYSKKLDLKKPKGFNEKLQWLKLNDRNSKYISLVDKYEVKQYVSNLIGEEYVIPTIGLYDRFEDIDFEKLPNEFVIKCTHDSGGLVVCKNKNKLDIDAARRKIGESLKNNYYYHGREWPYKNVKPRIIIEKFMSVSKLEQEPNIASNSIDAEKLQSEQGLLDYKFMCFDGKVKIMFLDIGVIGKGTGHAEEYYRNVYDEKFNLLPVLETRENYPIKVNKPKNFEKMVEIAEKLSYGLPHVRVDLYNIEGAIFFGEMTFFHGSGLSNYFIPEEWNEKLGNYINLKKYFNFK